MKIIDIDMAEAIQAAEHMGRNGDTELVHVNKGEEAMLKAHGGAGTRNPRTGLREYYDATGSLSGGAAGGTADSGGSGSHAPGSAGGANTGGGNKGAATDAKGDHDPASANKGVTDDRGGSTKGTDSLNNKDKIPNRGNSDTQAAGVQAPGFKAPSNQSGDLNPNAYKAAYNKRMGDYNNEGNSFFDYVGNLLAGSAGFNEIKPKTSDRSLNENADWGWDPAGTIGGIAGMGLGLPPFVGGTAASILSYFLGKPLEQNVGPDVMQTVENYLGGNFTTNSAADNWLGGGEGNRPTGTPSGSAVGRTDTETSPSRGQEHVFGKDSLQHALESRFQAEGGGAGGQYAMQGNNRQQQATSPTTGNPTPPTTGGNGTPAPTQPATGTNTPTNYTWDNVPTPGKDDHKWTKQFNTFKKADNLQGYLDYLAGRGKVPQGTKAGTTSTTPPVPTTPTTDPSQAGGVLNQLITGLQFPFFSPIEPFTIDMSLHDDILRNALAGVV